MVTRFNTDSGGSSLASTGRSILLGIVGVVTLIVGYGCFYTVDEAERVVILRNGAYQTTELPGWHFKTPLIDSVVRLDNQTHTYQWGKLPDKFEAYSFDQQPANLRISVTLQMAPDKTREFYQQFRNDYQAAVSRLIAPQVQNVAKATFGKFTAARSVTQRTAVEHDTMAALISSLGPNSVFTIKGVQIEDIAFSPAYMTSIEQRMTAEVKVEQEKQNLEREKIEAQIKVTQAQGRADSALAEAKAAAEAIELKGNAEATAIKARGDALAQNPSLIGLVQAERWNGLLPTTMVPGSALPMLTIPTAQTPTSTAQVAKP